MAVRIFVSHSHNDNDFGIKLVRDLRRVVSSEEEIWYDVEGGLKPGDSWWSKIVKALTDCEIFLLIVSPDSMASEWVMREYEIALNRKKRIIPLFYRSTEIRADIEIIQGISFIAPNTYEAAFNELLAVLGMEAVYVKPLLQGKGQKQITSQKTKEDYMNEGLVHRRGRRYPQALVAFNRALELDPRDPYIYGRRADIYRAMRNYKEALDDFDRAFELDPKSATAWAYATRGRVYQGMKEYQKACDDFDRAYEMAPDDKWVNKWRDEAYKARDEYREAWIQAANHFGE